MLEQLWTAGTAFYLWNGDAVEGNGIRELLNMAPPDYVYVDPPWGQANLSNFYRKANINYKPDFHEFIAELISRLPRNVPIFMEMGVNWTDEVKGLFHTAVQVIPLTYYKKRPSNILISGIDASIDISWLKGMDDEHTPVEIMNRFPKGRWFDPCLGQGLTPLSAFKTGNAFVGCELNSKRFAVAISKLQKAGMDITKSND